MKISIFDTGPRNADKLEAAARFFASQLLHARTVDKVELDIEIINNHDVEGECISEDDHKNPRYFTIRLRWVNTGHLVRRKMITGMLLGRSKRMAVKLVFTINGLPFLPNESIRRYETEKAP